MATASCASFMKLGLEDCVNSVVEQGYCPHNTPSASKCPETQLARCSRNLPDLL